MAEEMLPGLKYVLRLGQEKDPCFRKHGLQKNPSPNYSQSSFIA